MGPTDVWVESGADTGFQSGGWRDFLGTKLFSGIRNNKPLGAKGTLPQPPGAKGTLPQPPGAYGTLP